MEKPGEGRSHISFTPGVGKQSSQSRKAKLTHHVIPFHHKIFYSF